MNLSEIVKKIFSPGPATSDMLASQRTKIAHIEFTSRCNLRCVFCFTCQPEYIGHDLDQETIRDIIEALKDRNPKVVSVNGHGETTIYKNWNKHCDNMLEAKMPLHIISNFAKQFSQAEVDTLSRFSSIEISCDSSDPKLFKDLRRGADLKNLALNILRVKAVALKEKRKLPNISLSCVVSDRNVMLLDHYVAFGKALGVDHFNFCNLTKYPDVPGAVNARHITEMPLEQMELAEKSLKNMFKFLRESRILFHVQQGLMDSLQQKLNELRRAPQLPQPEVKEEVKEEIKDEIKEEIKEEKKEDSPEECKSVIQEPAPVSQEPQRYGSDRPDSQTRDCIDPWEFILVQANRDVRPCCWHKPIHSLGVRQSPSEVFNNTRIRDLRARLLTGDLTPDCLTCPSRGWTSTDNLKKKVWRYLNPGIHRLTASKIPEIKPDIFKEYPVTYGDGWYGLESDQNINEPEWRSWRWMSAKAACELVNPQSQMLLILRGSVDKAVHPQQKIKITLNNSLLDEFTPGTAKFFKEYIITADMMGEGDTIPLTFETDKVMVPSKLNPDVGDDRELGAQVYYLFFGERIKG